MARPTTTDLVNLARKADEVQAWLRTWGRDRDGRWMPVELEDPAFWDACIALGKAAEHLVSKLSNAGPSGGVDSETSKDSANEVFSRPDSWYWR